MALPGSRVAINLAGVSAEGLERGFVITTAGWLKPTRLVDVKLRAISSLSEPVKHNEAVTFHTGAGEVAGSCACWIEKDLVRERAAGDRWF